MDAMFIAGAVPVFFILIGIEYFISNLKKRPFYHFADAINSLSCGILQQTLAVFCVFWLVNSYTALYDLFHLINIPLTSPTAWILCFIGADLAYYLFHWASHRVNIIWATHVVHHQSEEYNLSTALRQSAFQGFFSTLFNWPLVLIGFPPLMVLTVVTLITLYQFWIHTRLIDRLGWFDKIFNSPSHHRVHHGIDPECIDKNYAGLFIIWDKLFGTFTPEGTGKIHYGTVVPLRSWNPLWANIEGWAKIWELSKSCNRWSDKLYAWIAPPEWRPSELGGTLQILPVNESSYQVYSSHESRKLQWYIALQFIPVVIATVLILLIQTEATPQKLATLALWITASLLSWGALLENKSWGKLLEALRLIALPFLIYLFC